MNYVTGLDATDRTPVFLKGSPRYSMGFLCALFLTGCSNNGPAMVSGKVHFEGQSFNNWVIHLVPLQPGSGTSARLESNGTFHLKSRLDPGEPYVAFFTGPEEEFDASGKPLTRGTPEPSIPPKYRSDTTSDLRVDVVPGQSWVEFKLEK
jgi:hypothetical protein